MTDAEILAILKTDLQVSSPALDASLSTLIAWAQRYISSQGVLISDTPDDGLLVEMYASYLYRKRREESAQMPRMLRWALNNRIFSAKMRGGGESG